MTQHRLPIRDMRMNVWRTLSCATDQEIHDGINFYPGANGLCHILSLALSRPRYTVTPTQIAGMYAALSPMNTWDTNVSNVVDLVRYGQRLSDWDYPEFLPGVNTTNINRDKALRILFGESPSDVLGGSKVRAFFAGIDDPDDTTPIAVDRHLINCAVGLVAPTKREQADMAHDSDMYARVERVYRDLGAREGIGNRLAAIVWFVQRRLSRTGQRAMPHPSMLCCGELLQSHGTKPRRFICATCGSSRTTAVPKRRDSKCGIRSIEYDFDLPITASQLSINDSRPRVYLGKSHPYATSGGVSWLARYVVAYRTGERLHPDEHVHHCDGNKLNCLSVNLKVLLAADHGRLHARKQLMYMLRDRLGRWASGVEVPAFDGSDVV